MSKYYAGIDLHRRSYTYYGSDEAGKEVCMGKADNTEENIGKMLQEFQGRPEVVIEATRNWMWMVRVFQRYGCLVKLAHPLKVKAISAARIKTDKIDARTLCHLLRTGMIPAAYIATEREQDYRELSRGRSSFVKTRTYIKNRIHALLGKENLNFAGTDLFGVNGLEWLKEQELPEGKRTVVELSLEELDKVGEIISRLDEEITSAGSGLPQIAVLKTIPGIGTTTAFLIAAEIGDVSRFNSSKQLASYLGLVPRLSQSGNHAYYGRITKQGNPYVRWSLVQAAWRMYRTDEEARIFVDRIAYRGGRKKAIVALARKLATIVFCILKENRPYRSGLRRGSRPAIIAERVAA